MTQSGTSTINPTLNVVATGGVTAAANSIYMTPPTTQGSGNVGIGTTSFMPERTYTSNAAGALTWDDGTPDYIARIEDLPAGTWYIRCDYEAYYNSFSSEWGARIIGQSGMFAGSVSGHPERSAVWDNAGTGSYSNGGTWCYIACDGPQGSATPAKGRAESWARYQYNSTFLAGVVTTTTSGNVWFQVKDYEQNSHYFKVRNVQLTAFKVGT